MVKNGPHPDLAFAYVNEMLGAEFQSAIAGPTFSLPTNRNAKAPANLPQGVAVHPTDWANVAANRSAWIQRWDRELAI